MKFIKVFEDFMPILEMKLTSSSLINQITEPSFIKDEILNLEDSFKEMETYLNGLSVKNIMKNHKLAQAMSDVSLGAFYSMLEYKCDWNDKQFVKIGRFFPSSKMCSNCGWIKV